MSVGLDSGIRLWHACGTARAVHNTIVATGGKVLHGIEYRFADTNAVPVPAPFATRDRAMVRSERGAAWARPFTRRGRGV